MSEEQPVFKVTDRRLFNPDGTPRDIPREEETAAKPQTPAKADEAAATSAAADAPEAPSRVSGDEGAAVENAAPAVAAETQEDATTAPEHSHEEEEEDYAEGDIPGADDPTSFVNFLMSIATNAAVSLGMMDHPGTRERSVDPEVGKHWIDILGMLKEKTRGNLAPQEQQIFDGLLADLRMQYVSLTSARPTKQPRGFSGSDITGGR